MNTCNGHFQRPGLGTILALVAIPVALFALVLGVQAAQANANTPSAGPIHPTGVEDHPLGIPAITPRASLATVSGPRFTQSDVIQYINANPKTLGAIPGKPAPVVTSVQFVTAKQASALLQGESIGLPDDAPVCIVHAKGMFAVLDSPPASAKVSPNPGYVTSAEVIFDAHTGNLIIGPVY